MEVPTVISFENVPQGNFVFFVFRPPTSESAPGCSCTAFFLRPHGAFAEKSKAFMPVTLLLLLLLSLLLLPLLMLFCNIQNLSINIKTSTTWLLLPTNVRLALSGGCPEQNKRDQHPGDFSPKGFLVVERSFPYL